MVAFLGDSFSASAEGPDLPNMKNLRRFAPFLFVMHYPCLSNTFPRKKVREFSQFWSGKTWKSQGKPFCSSPDNHDCVFQNMFSDSEVGKSFMLGKSKCSYYALHGVAPHFYSILVENVRKSRVFGSDLVFLVLADVS